MQLHGAFGSCMLKCNEGTVPPRPMEKVMAFRDNDARGS